MLCYIFHRTHSNFTIPSERFSSQSLVISHQVICNILPTSKGYVKLTTYFAFHVRFISNTSMIDNSSDTFSTNESPVPTIIFLSLSHNGCYLSVLVLYQMVFSFRNPKRYIHIFCTNLLHSTNSPIGRFLLPLSVIYNYLRKSKCYNDVNHV